jgi:guanosine-3',5'-bis(diphosphate) 3'-pyrophosphohydrolase
MSVNVPLALSFATFQHGIQARKRIDEPYINHSIRVADIVKEVIVVSNINDVDYLNKMIAVALLHDVLEDTDAIFEDLIDMFGDDVARMVMSLTNDKDIIEKMGKNDYLSLKVNCLSDDELVVKLADRLDNIQDLDNKQDNDSWSEYYADQTELIFLKCLDRKNYTMPQRILINRIRDCLIAKGYIG